MEHVTERETGSDPGLPIANQPQPGETDFKEIAHSGGKIIFNIQADEHGRARFGVTFTGSRPVPMRMFAIYALPQGIPVGVIELGGIGTPWNAPPDRSCIPVFIASDSEGYFGHQCPRCEGYWRSGRTAQFCPYCGTRGEVYQFLTTAHLSYLRHYADTLMEGLNSVEANQAKQVIIDMDAIVDSASDVPKPGFYHPGTSQQTRFQCVQCGTENDIRGRFGYCAFCGWRSNVADLRTQVENLRAELNSGRTTPEELVKKMVSLFDACCRDFVAQLAKFPMRPRRRNEVLDVLFHRLEASEVIDRAFDIELLKGMSDDLQFLRRMFQRRHVFEHEGGVASRRYIEESGDGTITEGTLIRETRENAHRLASCFVRIATNFEIGFHEMLSISPPASAEN